MNETAPHLEVRPLPPRPQPAEQALAEARTQADHIRNDAIDAAGRTRLAAQADAQTARKAAAEATTDRQAAARAAADARQLLAAAEQKTATAERRTALTDLWGPRASLAATIVLTASGEFALATLSGWPTYVAWALPMSIDVYVVQAFRRHRDVAGALILMVVTNAVYHLAAAGLVGVQTSGAHRGEPLWWLIVGVAAIAPWVMWRIHRITDERPGERADAQEAPTTEHAQPLTAAPGERAHEDARERPAPTPDAQDDARPDAQQPIGASVTETPASALPTTTVSAPMSALTPPATSSNEHQASARTAPKAKARKGDAQRQDDIVSALYDQYDRRPAWTEIRDALVAQRLADPTASRSTMQRIRERVERDHPALAARGSVNVRALAPTGTGS